MRGIRLFYRVNDMKDSSNGKRIENKEKEKGLQLQLFSSSLPDFSNGTECKYCTNHIMSAWKLHDYSFFRSFVLCSLPAFHSTQTRDPVFPRGIAFCRCASPVLFPPFRPNFLYYFLFRRVCPGFFGVLPFLGGIAERGESCILVFSPRKEKGLFLSGRNMTLFTRLRLSQFVPNGLNQFRQIFWFEVFSVFHFSILLKKNV